MNENVLLQIILHEDDGIEVAIGNSQDINPLILVGILEQVKLNIIQEAQSKQKIPNPTKSYDA